MTWYGFCFFQSGSKCESKHSLIVLYHLCRNNVQEVSNSVSSSLIRLFVSRLFVWKWSNHPRAVSSSKLEPTIDHRIPYSLNLLQQARDERLSLAEASVFSAGAVRRPFIADAWRGAVDFFFDRRFQTGADGRRRRRLWPSSESRPKPAPPAPRHQRTPQIATVFTARQVSLQGIPQFGNKSERASESLGGYLLGRFWAQLFVRNHGLNRDIMTQMFIVFYNI